MEGGAEFSWTPIAVDVGKYSIAVYVGDVNGHRGGDIMGAYVFAGVSPYYLEAPMTTVQASLTASCQVIVKASGLQHGRLIDVALAP